MKNSSEADILAVVESAKRAASNLMRTGRVWEYSLLSRIMKSPDPIGRMIEELQSRGNAVVGIPTKDPAPAVPAKTHWSLPVHLRRSCMRTSSEADILAVVESAKRAVSNLMRTGRVWEYSLLSRIMQSPDTIGRMIEELESRGNAVVGIPTEAPTAAVPAVPDVPVEAPAESSSESSGELYQCPDTTKQGTSLRERMASLGYYKKHSLDHDLLVSFAKFLQFDMSNENFKQEVENVARFLYFMDPQQASLLFVRQHEKSREYFLKLSEAGLSKQTVQNYIKSVKRFLKFHTGSTDLCFTDRVLHEDCKNYISLLDNIQMATSKQVSKETTRKRFDTFQEGVLSSTQVTAVLAAAKKDFLAVIGKLHAGECSPGHQLTLTELQLVLYYLEAIVILEHAQRPGVVTEWISRRRDDTRPGFVVVAVKEHKTAATQVATFVLTQEQEMWFDLYFSEVRPVMLGKKRKRVEDDDETDERFFISSTGKAIYNASNDLERLHKKYQVPKVTSQMARRAYETATKELSDVQKTKVAGYLTHSEATAEKHYRMKEIGSAVDAFLILRNLRGDSDSDQSDTPRGSSAYLTDQAAYDKLLRSYPVTLQLVLYYLEAIVILEHAQRPGVVEHMTKLPSESRVKAWIEKQGWSANLPDAASIVQQWKPSGGIDVAMDSVVLQKFCRTQRWKGLAVADIEGKGRGVLVTRPFALGEVVCDYHGKVVSRQEGLATPTATAEKESGYMFFYNSGQVARCIDAHEEECPCHPGMCTFGRLINHSSKKANLRPRLNSVDGKDVILFIAIRNIKVQEELLFDYGVNRKSFAGEGVNLDCLFFAQHCARLAAPLEHPHQYFVRLWLSWPLRSIVSTWSNSGPKAETLPDYYQHLVRWSKSLPAGLRPDTWSRVQPKGLDNRLQDLNWQCVHGKLPVREVLYRHGLTSHPRCPRPACAKDESLRHVFWECGYARATWSKVDGLCRALDPQFVLTHEKVMRGWSHDTSSPFLSRMWLLVSVTKRELWNARTSLIQKGTILDIVGIYRKICADLRFRMEHDVIRWGYHAAKERWRDLLEL
ncbi:hypothetical protein SRHO_G00186840 [Serrasalmus rhombeus]